MALLDRQAEAAYLQCLVGQAKLMPLPPELEARVEEWTWADLRPEQQEHWREIVRAVMRA